MTDRVSRPGASQAASGRGDSGLDRNVLDSMAEGVLTVGADGRVEVFNPAAARILGLDEARIRGQPFAATMPNVAGLDEFSDAVLAAIYDGAVGDRSTVTLRSGDGAERSLAVTASYLTGGRDAEEGRAGIVAVFSDVTEIEALRRAERELVEETRDQNARLRDTYREI